MRTIIKIATVILIIITMYGAVYSVQANGIENIWNDAKNFLDTGASGNGLGGNVNPDTAAQGFIKIADFLWGLGLLVIFICTVVLGIKYMLVLPSEKSRIKQATTPYIIGVIIIFGAVTIWKFVITIMESGI